MIIFSSRPFPSFLWHFPGRLEQLTEDREVKKIGDLRVRPSSPCSSEAMALTSWKSSLRVKPGHQRDPALGGGFQQVVTSESPIRSRLAVVLALAFGIFWVRAGAG